MARYIRVPGARFYERLGYTWSGELPNDPMGSRYFMKKALQKNYPYTIDNGQGERLTFMGVVNEGGPRALADGVAQPGSGPPMHVHYLQEEGVRVVRG